MNFSKLIKDKRHELNESQSQFGRRFNMSHAAVSDWESGKSEAPYVVLSFCMKEYFIDCPYCKGSGQIPVPNK